MLPKANRLKKQKDFDRVFKSGKSFKEGFLFLKVAPNDMDINRFGFVVSREFSKKAVLRNKTKRKLREIIRRRLDKIKEGTDGVIIAYPGLEKEEFKKIEKTIDNLFKKAKLF